MEEEIAHGLSSDTLDQSKTYRQKLLQKLSDVFGYTCVLFFTSQHYPVTLDMTDADILEEVLSSIDLQKGLCLILDTLGGDGIAAERIVRVCRVYSHGKFDVLVVRRAKSAGTIIAMGANRIFMGETSALGRIDPQILIKEKEGNQYLIPAHVIVASFDKLVNRASTSNDKLEIYLQQLHIYDGRQIELIRRQMKMTEDIAIKCLREGMLAGDSRVEIRKKAVPFVTPVVTKAHTRDIFFEEVKAAGLKVELVSHDSSIWSLVSDLYINASDFVNSKYCKLIESSDCHHSLPWNG